MFNKGTNKNETNLESNAKNTQVVNVAAGCAYSSCDFSLYNDNIPYTLEQHLKSFESNGLYSYLWNSWIVEKIKYIQLLETNDKTCLEYSIHNANHSEKVVENIERLLGSERITLLSPSDTWFILQCAYTHDIGMSVSNDEKYKFIIDISTDKEAARNLPDYVKNIILDYVKELMKSRDGHYKYSRARDVTRNAAEFWYHILKQPIDMGFLEDSVYGEEFMLAMYYYELIVAEYFRSKHADRSREMLLNEIMVNITKDPIPSHMRRAVAEVVKCHGGSFNSIYNLEPLENGFNRDYIHPRFAAALLRLGDLLDLDSTRFNPFQLRQLSRVSRYSYEWMIMNFVTSKISINQAKICITANYETNLINELLNKIPLKDRPEDKDFDQTHKLMKLIVDSVKRMREWMNWININAKEFRIGWDEIAPVGFPGNIAVPDPRKMQILIDGVCDDKLSLELKYEIDPSRAAHIVEGAGLYDIRFAFLREVIQNAIDATKRQIYRDIKKAGIFNEIDSIVSFFRYFGNKTDFLENKAILVNFSLECDSKNVDDKVAKYFVIRIEDKGVGITRTRLDKMQHIGAIHDQDMDDEYDSMPEWLRPTGDFGIGLQSVFLVADQFSMKSRPKRPEDGKFYQRRIIFNNTQLGGDISNLEKIVSEIGVAQWEDNPKSVYPEGTLFEVKIDLTKQSEFIKEVTFAENTGLSMKEFRLNLSDLIIRMCKKYIEKTLIEEIIPIRFGSFNGLNFTKQYNVIPYSSTSSTYIKGNICINTSNDAKNASSHSIYF